VGLVGDKLQTIRQQKSLKLVGEVPDPKSDIETASSAAGTALTLYRISNTSVCISTAWSIRECRNDMDQVVSVLE